MRWFVLFIISWATIVVDTCWVLLCCWLLQYAPEWAVNVRYNGNRDWSFGIVFMMTVVTFAIAISGMSLAFNVTHSDNES